ncbi:AI-2E family transporter [Enterococcus dongliensis]|uniref:AI-2E family transporter n=1 Tax=Enterococcus dongliensis TaxID=2559925 RepID=A0AAP5NIU8_9ENTE|nr:AI-2E family transporter [Enterococcus dongliensis]MDT2597558.1 AI-2E family transporter [Enterococcus dongliensis]MDT2603083.1 AI-2E family transporter [Enterococcus dongliensis]MDT2633427.1 AI-2E family transporter [Enterococcus dongliensis]MDT2636778.1 AI-2E family transporter [Enterococcus dongliensis]MDT2638897.1 AI-2E family transporter [Enterococcus dongliensis]
MFEKIKNSKLMFWSIEVLIIVTVILVSSKIDFVFQPIGTFFTTLFSPILIAGFLYYLLNPLVNLLVKLGVKRLVAIALIFVLLIGLIVLIFLSMIPNLVEQLISLAKNIPGFVENMQTWLQEMANSATRFPLFKELDVDNYISNFDVSASSIIQQSLTSVTNGLGSIIGKITTVVLLLITVPFILFYMLKDGEKLVPNIERLFPEKQQKNVKGLLQQLNKTLSNYISGQAIECVFVGTFTFLGYLLIGVDYAFLFGVIAGLTNLIPYLGPYLGLAPALVYTFFDSPYKALLCILIVLIVQQVDGNVIYPNVIGKTLNIHPLTIILILLVAGKLAGLLGVFLGVPVYAILRTVIVFIVKIVKQSKQEEREQEFLH